MSDQITVTVNYAGRDFHLTGDEGPRVAAQLTGAAGPVTFDHTGGRSTIVVSAGVPITVDYR